MNNIPFIFCAFANDKARYLDQLPQEANDIAALFRDKKHLCEIEVLSHTRPTDLHDVIVKRKNDIHIVHYGGHTNGRESLLVNDAHQRQYFENEAFADLLKGLPQLKLVFINGCSSSAMVQYLYDAGIAAVIGTTTNINDLIAFQLSVAFYKGIAQQLTILEAWNAATALIRGQYKTDNRFRDLDFGENEVETDSPHAAWFIKLREGAGDWKLTEMEVSDRVRNFEKVPNPIGNFPPAHNTTSFSLAHPTIGRENDLAAVRKMLTAQQQCIVVNGIGGIGKTTLAKYYIAQYKSQYKHIIWLQEKDTAANILLDDSLFLARLGIEKDVLALKNANNPNAALELTLSKLNELPKQTLLVADNVHDLHGFQTICNVLNKDIFHLLATSRKQAGNFFFHKLDHLSPPDAKDLFIRFCEKKTKGNLAAQNALLENPALARILAKIDYHTLTIEIIAKIYNNSRTLSLESLEQQLAQAVLNTKLSQTAYTHYTQKETTLLETLLAAFDISGLSQQTNALEILAQWAILPATPIPFAHLIALFGITEENKNDFDTALTFLIENAWIQQAKETEDSYACHALIQEAVKLQITNRVQNFSKVQTPILTDKFSYAPLIERLSWLFYIKSGDNPLEKAIWLPYATSILNQFTEETEILATLSNNTAEIYIAMGDLPKSLEYGLKSIEIFEKILSPDHPDLATSYNNIAETYRAIGDLPKSLEYGLKSMKIWEKILSSDHPDLAQSYNNIAGTYEAMGNLPKSLEYGLKSMEIREKILSPDHPDLATSYNNIAITYKVIGDLVKSLEYGLKSMEIFEKIHSPDHPDLATSYNNIANTYRDMGDLPKSLEYGLKSMAIMEKIFSPDHPNLATSYITIAVIYQAMGDFPKSLEYGLKSMEIFEKILSPEHPSLAKSYGNIAGIYEAMGDLPKALEYRLKDLAIHKKILSPDHPNLAISYNNIASTYRAMGDLHKSLEYGLKSMEIREKILSPDHPNLATSYNNIAHTYYYLQDYLQSLAYLQKAILIRRKSLPKGHPNTKTSIDSMAYVLKAAIDAGQVEGVREYAVWYVQEVAGEK